VGDVVQAGTASDLPKEVVAAYDAPFPSEEYKAGARVMPTLVMSQTTTNKKAWSVFEQWEKPFLTLFADSDPITRGGANPFQKRIPGAKTQPHQTIADAGHFLQEDKGEELARIIVTFIADNPLPKRTASVTADDIPVAHTPKGYWKTMPPPILTGCVEPLAEGAVDMRGLWEVVESKINGKPLKRLLGHRQRIEQCGNRVVVTGGGVVHDMRCDGTYENGVNDIGEPSTGGRPISVAASFENGVHVLRPKGLPGITVEREIVDGELIWRYGPALVLRLKRVGAE
jgi:hypothetical protein